MSKVPKFQDDAVPMEEDDFPPPLENEITGYDVVPGPRSDEEEYPMTHIPRGRAVIFNHYQFNSNLKLHRREGTNADKRRMKEILLRLGMQLNEDDICDDFTLQDIQKKLGDVSREDHSKYDCLIVVVMTHGSGIDVEKKEMSKIYAFDQGYHETELWKPFLGNTCRSLRAKPKLFFIQACRGTEKQKGFLISSSKAQRETLDRSEEVYSIPNNADLLVARSTSQGCLSFRHVQRGTVFIQSLCDELEIDLARENSAKKDVNKILLGVNRKVAQFGFVDENDETESKQMSWAESSLTRELYFREIN